MNGLADRLRAFVRMPDAKADWVGARHVHEVSTGLTVRNEKFEGSFTSDDEGVMIEVLVDGQIGYAATCDLSDDGLVRARDRAIAVTRSAAPHKLFPWDAGVRAPVQGHYRSPEGRSLISLAPDSLFDLLRDTSAAMQVGDAIVTRTAFARSVETHMTYVGGNGMDIVQDFTMIFAGLGATASDGQETQHRSCNISSHQQGAEILDRPRLAEAAARTGREALALLDAEDCPSGVMDLIAMPDQMDLQVHESIGHPLELDRILGDERNYAGWSFVRPGDFGTLRYGTDLMNVTFDPGFVGELASYAFDDTGTPARRDYLIRDGILLRGLGGLESQTRSGLPGVANMRASSWNRAPIDRMANINLEPGSHTLDEMIGSVTRGVLMFTNRSWSIDDYRDKFQFGCEYGRLIENGRLTRVVKNPNYRGRTTEFWNRLAGVGRADTRVAYGTPYCGKGEPNQIIRVGHATPPCLFRDVDIFGRAS